MLTPSLSLPASIDVVEDATAATGSDVEVATFTVTGAYMVDISSGNENGHFYLMYDSVSTASLYVSALNPLDFESASTHTLTIDAWDMAGNSASGSLTVNVLDVAEADGVELAGWFITAPAASATVEAHELEPVVISGTIGTNPNTATIKLQIWDTDGNETGEPDFVFILDGPVIGDGPDVSTGATAWAVSVMLASGDWYAEIVGAGIVHPGFVPLGVPRPSTAFTVERSLGDPTGVS